MVGEKVYYKHVGEHSQRLGHLRESSSELPLSHVRGREKEEREAGAAAARRSERADERTR